MPRFQDFAGIRDGAEGAERDVDPFCVVPANLRVNDFDELIDGRGSRITRIEQLRLESPEETLEDCIIRRTSFARHRANQSGNLDTREPSWPAIVRAPCSQLLIRLPHPAWRDEFGVRPRTD